MKKNNKKIIKNKLRIDFISKISIFLFSTIGILILLIMFFAILQASFPAYRHYGFFHMYFTANFTENGGWGIWGGLIITIFTSIIALLIATPLALRASFFIIFRLKWGKNLVNLLINILAGVPSVIFGVFAINAFGNLSKMLLNFDSTVTIANAILILVLMIFPTLVALISNQLKSVDVNLINSAIALGDSKTSAIYKVAKKSIRAGIWVAVITALGRAIGETMALSMILTNQPSPTPFGHGLRNFLGQGYGSLGVEIAKNFYTDSDNEFIRSALFAAGIALFGLIMILVIGASKLSSSKKIENINPLLSRRIINKKHYPLLVFYYLKLAWHWCFMPLRLMRFIFVMALEWWARIWSSASYYAFYPLILLIFPRKKTKETISKYFIKVKTNWRNSIPDITRIVLEIVSTIIIMGGTLWILLNVLLNGIPNWTLQQWQFRYYDYDPIFDTTLIKTGVIASTMLFTFVLVSLTLIISFPFALMTALFLSEYAKDSKTGRTIKFFLDSLGGTPSIIFGIFGVLFFRITLNIAGGRLSVIAAVLTMVLVVIPVFTRAIEQVLIRVPDAHRQASYALGASKFETIRKVILPQALPGIFSGLILSAGRIIAETAPVYLLIGMLGNIKIDLLDQGWTMTTRILFNQIYASGSNIANTNESYAIAAAAIILISLLITFTETLRLQFKYIYQPIHHFNKKYFYSPVKKIFKNSKKAV